MKNGLIVDGAGNKFYYLNNQLHRLDSPAIEYISGTKLWYQYGHLHRLDGPAIEDMSNVYVDILKSWWYYGQKINCKTQEEFEKIIKLKAFW